MLSMSNEKQTNNAIAFTIDLPSTGSLSEKDLLIKQRLEAESAAFAPCTSLEQINAKLEKAEEKRKLSLNFQNSEEKRKRVFQRKSTLEEANLEKNSLLETHLSAAE